MAQVWDDDPGDTRRRQPGARADTMVYYATSDRTAVRRASRVRRMADGGRRLPAAPQAIGRLLVLLACVGVVLLMGALLWVGLGVFVTVLLRMLGP